MPDLAFARLAARCYTSSGFRFRRRKAWGFKSLLVHNFCCLSR
jgi:hypothetical protein